MKRVAIVGSGLIGRSWAIVFARAGWTVALYDAVDGVATSAIPLIEAELNSLAKLGLVDDPRAAIARVTAAATLEQALDGADFVQENGPEDLDAKIAILPLHRKAQRPRPLPRRASGQPAASRACC
jgi:L-gulonate 3-dehydrogenase